MPPFHTSSPIPLSLSADALGIGLAYGLRRISFPPLSRLLLAAETFFMMEGFLLLGGLLSQFVPQGLAERAGQGFLLLFGIWLCLQGFGQKKEADSPLAAVHAPSGMSVDFLPLFAALFQTAFLSVGAYMGAKLTRLSNTRENLWSLLSGGILICIALLQ